MKRIGAHVAIPGEKFDLIENTWGSGTKANPNMYARGIYGAAFGEKRLAVKTFSGRMPGQSSGGKTAFPQFKLNELKAAEINSKCIVLLFFLFWYVSSFILRVPQIAFSRTSRSFEFRCYD